MRGGGARPSWAGRLRRWGTDRRIESTATHISKHNMHFHQKTSPPHFDKRVVNCLLAGHGQDGNFLHSAKFGLENTTTSIQFRVVSTPHGVISGPRSVGLNAWKYGCWTAQSWHHPKMPPSSSAAAHTRLRMSVSVMTPTGFIESASRKGPTLVHCRLDTSTFLRGPCRRPGASLCTRKRLSPLSLSPLREHF